MIKVEISRDKKIILSNITIMSKQKIKDLKLFISFLNLVLDEYSGDDEIISFNSNILSEDLKQIETFFDDNEIQFEKGEKYLELEKKLNVDIFQFEEIKKIGYDIKKKNFGKLYKEFQEFQQFSEAHFSERHIPYKEQMNNSFFHIKVKKSCNFSSPGTGKTTVVYAMYNWLRNKTKEINSIFIIGPLSSFISWKEEYRECFGKSPLYIDPKLKNFKNELKIINAKEKNRIYFLNYQKIKSCKLDLINFFKKNKIFVVLDEAHRIKNPNTKINNELNEIFYNSNIQIEYKIILTGTPNPNGYENLFAYFDLLKKNKPKIISKNYRELKEMNNKSEKKIQELIQEIFPFFVCSRKEDMQDFKNPEIEVIECEMDQFQKKIYNIINKKLIESLSNDVDKIIIIEFKNKLLRLMQIQTDIRMLTKPVNEIILNNFDEDEGANDFFEEEEYKENKNIIEFSTFEESAKKWNMNFSEIKYELLKYEKNVIPSKYLKLLEIVKKLTIEKQKIIIWSNWVYTIKQIKELLDKANIRSELLYGKVSFDEKQNYIEEFKNSENLMVLVANPFSVGESISLHKSTQNAIYFDINYNVTSHFQSKDRIHRCNMPKGKEQVRYYYLLSKESYDEKIFEHLKFKELQMKEFLEKNQNLISLKDGGFHDFLPSLENFKNKNRNS